VAIQSKRAMHSSQSAIQSRSGATDRVQSGATERTQQGRLSEAAVFRAIHALALRGRLVRLPVEPDELLATGLVQSAPDGFTLTDLGHRRHRALLEGERATLDTGRLGITCARIPAVARRLRAVSRRWEAGDLASNRELIDEVCRIVDDVEPILRNSTSIAPRFGDYIPRLEDSRQRLRAGDLDYALAPTVESIGTVCRELHEDYLQTLGWAPESDEL
jgi:hypothetical protein